jgi:hypothetical protein
MHCQLHSFPSTAAAEAFWRSGGGTAGEHAALAAATEGERVVLLPEQTQLVLSSSTAWRFLLVSSPEAVPRGFQEPGFQDSSWAIIPVPANWQLCGFDTPIYSNITCAFFSRETTQRSALIRLCRPVCL